MSKTSTGKSASPGHIYLIGFSGSGKSTVGPILARKLRRRFIDTDKLIERELGRSIAELFATEGEARFRQLESAVLAELAHRSSPAVIALGGGAFKRPENRKLVFASGAVIYLRSSIKELYRRLKTQTDRPLLRVRAKSGETVQAARVRRIQALLESREETYNMADIVVSTTTRTPAEVADQIIDKIVRHHAHRTR